MDQTIHCMICRSAFIHTEREQQFLEGLFREGKIDEVSAPKRCRPCREKKPRLPAPYTYPAAVAAQRDAAQTEITDPVERRDPAKEIKESISVADRRTIEQASRPANHEESNFVLVAGDFERLVCRQEVELRGPKGQIVKLKLADIGLAVMKEVMKKAVLAWWVS